ncbi:MAG: hypothetical protein U1F18_07400 [Steroidobacteraceae bacterium]
MPVPITRRLLCQASSIVVLVVLACSASAPLLAREGGFDAAALEAWSRAHGGVDGPRTYAYSGTVYDVPGGKVLATVDGWQLARTFPGGARDPGAWYVVRRAFLLYRAPGSGEILARYPDVRARSAPVPVLSIVRFALRGDRVVTSGVSGVRGATREVALPEQLGATREDDAWVFLRVLSPPDPQQKPIELTEIVARDGATDAAPRARFVMTKIAENWGFLPPGGRHVLHLSWRPVAGLESVAPVLRQLVTAEAPPALASLPSSLEAAYAELGLPLPSRPIAP